MSITAFKHSELRRSPDLPLDTFIKKNEQRLGHLPGELHYTQIDEIIVESLHKFLNGLQTRLNRIDDAAYKTFFALSPVTGAGNLLIQEQ